jgi:hypothetical protein
VTPIVSYDSGTGVATITGAKLIAANSLVVSTADVTFDGTTIVTSVGSVSGTNVTFASSYTVPAASLYNMTVNSGGGTATLNVSGTNYTSSNVLPGMTVVGTGIPDNTTVVSVTYDSNNKLTSITLSQAVSGTPPVLKVVGINSFSVTRYANTGSGASSTTIKPLASVAGLQVGMVLTGAGIPTGTTIQAIAGDGTITLSNAVDTTQLVSFTASSDVLASNSTHAVLNVASTTGFAVGQTIAGTGIPAGTTILAISNGQITLSNAVTSDGISAINNGGYTISASKVVSTSGNTVTLSSVAGLKVGSILSGDAAIPANAVITGINATTGVVTYTIDAAAANLTAGGAMNGLVATGTMGSNGTNGRGGTNYGTTFDNGEGAVGTNAGAGTAGTNNVGGTGGNGGGAATALPPTRR